MFSIKSVAGSIIRDLLYIFGSNAGYQCTANALATLIFSSLFAVSQWSSHDVDQILLFGDSLFLNVIHDWCQGNQFYLMASTSLDCKPHGAAITHSVSI